MENKFVKTFGEFINEAINPKYVVHKGKKVYGFTVSKIQASEAARKQKIEYSSVEDYKKKYGKIKIDESIDADTITKSLDSGAPYVHNIEKGYYGITDNIYELVEWLEAAASEDSDWKEELKIFQQVKKLVDKSKIGKFL